MPSQTFEPLVPTTCLEKLSISAGQSVADFGAGGSANWAAQIGHQVGPSGQVLMFDVRKPSLAAALNEAKIHGLSNCRGVWSNLEIFRGAKGIPDQSLDQGVVVNLLNETKYPKDVLTEIHRMLKVRAKLLIVDWHPSTTHRLAPPSGRRLAPEYVESIAKEVGFAPVEQFSPGPSYWGLVLQKAK